MEIRPNPHLYLADSNIAEAGRGVLTDTSIKAGKLIERCPIIYLTEDDYPLAKQTTLLKYYFLKEPEENRAAIALGFGSLYNHSYEPNATYEKQLEEGCIDFRALSDIPADTEITVNYNYGNPDDKKRLWIEEVPPYEAEQS